MDIKCYWKRSENYQVIWDCIDSGYVGISENQMEQKVELEMGNTS